VIGPIPGVSRVGENAAIFSAYCRADCLLREAELDGRAQDLQTGLERGYRYYRGEIRVPSGRTGTFRTDLDLPTAWDGNSSGGTYRLTFLNQTTIQPTDVRIEIRVPDGMEVRSMSGVLRREGDAVVYEGTPGRMLELEVSFSPSLPTRMWRNVTRVFTQPLFHL
jgi:hypothetical protein